MKRLFISYSRDDKARVEDLVRRLEFLQYEAWIDTQLKGGQSWWDEILRQIAACDCFVSVVSQSALASVACSDERGYASALGKPILPVAVEELTQALPRELSTIQVVNFADPSQDAAFALVVALRNIPDAPPLPDPMPKAPAVPLSYQTLLVELLDEPTLTKAQQRQILDEVEPALRSPDRDARAGARQILERMQGRDDLYADVAARIAALGPISEGGPPPPAAPPPPSAPPPSAPKKRSGVRTAVIVIGILAILGLGGCAAVLVWVEMNTPTQDQPGFSVPTTRTVDNGPIGPHGERVGDPCYADTPYGPQAGVVGLYTATSTACYVDGAPYQFA